MSILARIPLNSYVLSDAPKFRQMRIFIQNSYFRYLLKWLHGAEIIDQNNDV